ncbi:MAG: DUF2887 domain-containing protein, partial [Deltaproteobacteria bacterium]|nr:DUF2887 domain-containing protein [Deltaproteobacteria bacterium]
MPTSSNRGSDEAFYRLVQAAGEAILKLVGVAAGDQYHFHADTLKAKRVSPDIVAIPSTEAGDTVIMEFQGYHDPLIRYRVAAGVALYCHQLGKAPPFLPVIIFTERSFFLSALPYDISDTSGQYHLRGRFKEIVLEDYTEEQLLTFDPRLVVLAPYTCPKNMDKKELGERAHAWGDLVRKIYPEEQSHDQVDLLALFLLNRFRQLTREEVVAMLDFDLADTVAGQDIYKMGELQNAQKYVIEILKIRFGRVPVEIIDAVEELFDPSLLDALHRQAVLVKSIDEFEA